MIEYCKGSLFLLNLYKNLIQYRILCNHKTFRDMLRIIQIQTIGIISQKNYLRIENDEL